MLRSILQLVEFGKVLVAAWIFLNQMLGCIFVRLFLLLDLGKAD